MVLFVVVAVGVSIKGLLLVLADYEERRNIFVTVNDCAAMHARNRCRHVPHNDLWYGPWYRASADEPVLGPDAAEPKYRNSSVVNVERRDPKKIFGRRD